MMSFTLRRFSSLFHALQTALIGMLIWSVGIHAAVAEPVVAVHTLPLVEGRLVPSIAVVGRVLVDPAQINTLSLATAGTVVSLPVVPGQQVARGTVLAVVTPDPAAHQACVDARTQQASARAALAQQEFLRGKHLATEPDVLRAKAALSAVDGVLRQCAASGADQPQFSLRAPDAAMVQTVTAAPGARLPVGSTLLTLAPQAALRVQVGVPAAMADRVTSGLALDFSPALGAGRMMSATVVQVSGQMDPQTQQIMVLAKPTALDGVWAGMAVTGQLRLPKQTGWQVPIDAVVTQDGITQVFVLPRGAHTVRAVPVTVDARVGQQALISPVIPEAWQAGDGLVIAGQYELRDGRAVRVAKQATP